MRLALFCRSLTLLLLQSVLFVVNSDVLQLSYCGFVGQSIFIVLRGWLPQVLLT
jgi:hypothetical protein